MLSKSEFVEIINRLQAADELQDEVNKLFKASRDNLECDLMNAASLQISHGTIVIKLLTKIFYGDRELKENDIAYFIYELDYGRKYYPGSITTEDGTIIDLSTAEKLYDYLIEYRKELREGNE